MASSAAPPDFCCIRAVDRTIMFMTYESKQKVQYTRTRGGAVGQAHPGKATKGVSAEPKYPDVSTHAKATEASTGFVEHKPPTLLTSRHVGC